MCGVGGAKATHRGGGPRAATENRYTGVLMRGRPPQLPVSEGVDSGGRSGHDGCVSGRARGVYGEGARCKLLVF